MAQKKKNDKGKVEFSEVDCLILGEGLSPHAGEDEVDKARQLIEKKTGFTLITKAALKRLSSRTRKGQKPGRKAAVSTNATETEEAALLEYLRRDLGPAAAKLTKSQLLNVVLRLCQLLKTQREEGLFLSPAQRLSIRFIAQTRLSVAKVFASKHRNGELSLGASFVAEPTRSGVMKQLRALEESAWTGASQPRSWQSVVEDAAQSVGRHKGAKVSDRRAYQALRRALKLELDAREALSLFNGLSFPAPQGSKPPAMRKRGAASPYRQLYPKASVPRVLKVARENLAVLRNLVQGFWYCRINGAIENLYLLIRAWSCSNHPDAIPPAAAAIEKVFLDAIREQKTGPFPPISNEEVEIGAPEISVD